MSRKENIAWKISLLEAQTKAPSNIHRAKLIAEKIKRKDLKKARRLYKAQLKTKVSKEPNPGETPETVTSSSHPTNTLPKISKADPTEQLAKLRLLRAQQKIYHIQNRLTSVVKKNKGIQIQKIVKLLRKLKEKLENESLDDKKVHLERQIAAENALLIQIKDFDLAEISELLFVDYLVNKTNLQEFQKGLGLVDKIEFFNSGLEQGDQIATPNPKKPTPKQKVFKLLKTSNPVIECLKELNIVGDILVGDNQAISKKKLENRKATAAPATVIASSASTINLRLDSPQERENQLQYDSEGSQVLSDDFDSEIGSEIDSDREVESELRKLGESSLVLDSGSEFDSEMYSDYDEGVPTQKQKGKNKLKDKNKSRDSSSSQFLSSLGGLDFSDSEDDGMSDSSGEGASHGRNNSKLSKAEQAEAEVEARAKSKKNRMGQRQRRAYNEQLYGKQANHLQLLPKSLRANKGATEYRHNDRGKGFRPTNNLNPASDKFGSNNQPEGSWNNHAPNQRFNDLRPQQRQNQNQNQNQFTAYNYSNNSGGNRNDDVNSGSKSAANSSFAPSIKPPIPVADMHPSWIAKHAERQKIAMLSSGQVKGKKIVFD